MHTVQVGCTGTEVHLFFAVCDLGDDDAEARRAKRYGAMVACFISCLLLKSIMFLVTKRMVVALIWARECLCFHRRVLEYSRQAGV
jgi:hypothetical protein